MPVLCAPNQACNPDITHGGKKEERKNSENHVKALRRRDAFKAVAVIAGEL